MIGEVVERQLAWIGSSYDDLKALPRPVQREFGIVLRIAQLKQTPRIARPLKGFGGAGVLELKDDFDGDTYRAAYTVRLQRAAGRTGRSRRDCEMRTKEKVRFGSANVFADLEFENPEEELIRADLAAKVDALLSDREGTQKAIGQRLGLGQSEVSDLMRGRYGRFSIDRLLRILTRLGCKVDLKVTAPRRPGVLGRMTIRAA